MTKLEKKLARQARMTEKLMGNYSVGVKKAKGVKYSNNGLWRHNNEPQHNEFEIVLGGKIYKKVVR